jgi:lipoprotein-releasing system permease protein
VNIGDNLIVFFVQNPPRYRRMKVVGLFSSDIEEFDEHIVYTDYRVLQQINGWADSLVTGIEVSLNDFDRLDDEYSVLFDEMPYDMYAEKVTETHRHFFDWFVMLKRNVVIFLAVILFVACFNVISVLLIMVTERTEMIGILKSFGASNFAVQKIFFYNGIHLIIKGLLFGNAAALGFGYLQNTFKIIPLDPRNYYMESVPFRFDWGFILSANAAVALLSLVVLMIPVFFISRISPAKAIRFD